MLKLTHDETDREQRDVLPFPSEAVRGVAWGIRPERLDRDACDAARQVESAMAEVERRFSQLKLMMEQQDDLPPPPRAA